LLFCSIMNLTVSLFTPQFNYRDFFF